MLNWKRPPWVERWAWTHILSRLHCKFFRTFGMYESFPRKIKCYPLQYSLVVTPAGHRICLGSETQPSYSLATAFLPSASSEDTKAVLPDLSRNRNVRGPEAGQTDWGSRKRCCGWQNLPTGPSAQVHTVHSPPDKKARSILRCPSLISTYPPPLWLLQGWRSCPARPLSDPRPLCDITRLQGSPDFRWGPVAIDRRDPNSIGAHRPTNNSGEISAFFMQFHGFQTRMGPPPSPIVRRRINRKTGSEYCLYASL